MANNSLRDAATSNALSSVAKDRRLPQQVFVERWQDYLFFEPYTMFDVGFVDVVNLLLREENAFVVALINLGGGGTPDDGILRVMFLERGCDSKEYISKLVGKRSAEDWMFLMDRYACASDKGNWSIYCEKENDVAVFAVGESLPQPLVSTVGRLLQGKSIRSMSSSEGSQLFDFSKLVPEWKSSLRAEYLS